MDSFSRNGANGGRYPVERRRAGGRRILAIDNDPMISAVIQRILDRTHDVTACTSAEDALSLVARGETYEVILCDVLMPHFSGPDFYRELLELAPLLARRVVFITGAASLPENRQFLSAIPNAVLEKPFTSVELKATVEEVARGSLTTRARKLADV